MELGLWGRREKGRGAGIYKNAGTFRDLVVDSLRAVT